MNKALIRLPLVALALWVVGILLNYLAYSNGIIIPALWAWPTFVGLFSILVIWAIGGGFLVKRVWYWLFGAPWDAAGYIAGKSSKGRSKDRE